MSFRFKAFVLHIVISAVVICGASYLALSIWFPYPLFMIDGTWRAVALLGAIDFVLGPVITLVIASAIKSKGKLIFDYIVIGALQISALTFGLSQVYEQRIVALIHLDSNFHLVSARFSNGAENETDDISVKQYDGIYYGMLESIDFFGLDSDGYNKKSVSIADYRVPTMEVLGGRMVPPFLVPDELSNKYQNEVFYKSIVGKDKNGIAVLDENAEILEIVLMKEVEEGAD